MYRQYFEQSIPKYSDIYNIHHCFIVPHLYKPIPLSPILMCVKLQYLLKLTA